MAKKLDLKNDRPKPPSPPLPRTIRGSKKLEPDFVVNSKNRSIITGIVSIVIILLYIYLIYA